MTISSALNSGVAALGANASRLAGISDNIANAGTYGYKRVQTDFQSMVISTTGGGGYAAGGVRSLSQRLVDQSGALVNTSNPTDLAVRGRGFLPVARANEVQVGNGNPQMLLTTTGSFRTDADGYLVTQAGLALLGWPALPDGTMPAVPRDTADSLRPVRIDANALSGQPTTQMSLGINLPATATAAGATVTPETLSVEYIDNLGISANVDITFTPTVPGAGYSNEWRMVLRDSASGGAVVGDYVLAFNDSRTAGGTLAGVTTFAGGAYDAATGSVIVDVDGGPIEINIGQPGSRGGLTQLSDKFAPLSISKDGSAVGNMTAAEVDENGFVLAVFDTGVTRRIFQIPLVDMPNPNGMTGLDQQTFVPSPKSGPFFLWDAGDGPTGSVVAFAQEESATDVAGELTDMIKTQRAYSSNAKVIQTVALSLAEATDLPVEISPCVFARLLFTALRVCSATMALLLVRMLDMGFPCLSGSALCACCRGPGMPGVTKSF